MDPQIETNPEDQSTMPDRQGIREAIPRPVRQLLYELAARSRRRRWVAVPGIEHVAPEGGVVLTFDDGPDLAGTPEVLDALDAVNAKATFFVLGEHVRTAPELAREIRSRGHEIGLHGSTHYRHDLLSRKEAANELSDGLEAIQTAVGLVTQWYRPPFGRSSPELAAACSDLSLRLVYWTSWGHDWEAVTAKQIARRVNRTLRPGGIVLLHDSARYAQRDNAQPTIEAIPLIAEAAQRVGSPMVTLSSALNGTTA